MLSPKAQAKVAVLKKVSGMMDHMMSSKLKKPAHMAVEADVIPKHSPVSKSPTSPLEGSMAEEQMESPMQEKMEDASQDPSHDSMLSHSDKPQHDGLDEEDLAKLKEHYMKLHG